MSVITIRAAREVDADDIARLAELDEGSPPRGSTVLAFVDGRLAAARSLRDGSTVADPFIRTAEARALLELRAHQGAAA